MVNPTLLPVHKKDTAAMPKQLNATHDFISYCKSVESQLADDYQRIQRRVLEDPGTAGDQVEQTWLEILRQWLPASFPIVNKGRIIDRNGVASPQIDLLVLDPNYPKALRLQKTYFIGGVVAAFECKLSLDIKGIRQAARNAKLVKNLSPELLSTPYSCLVRQPIFGLLAHNTHYSGSKDDKAFKIHEKLMDTVLEESDKPCEMLDVLCIPDIATIESEKAILNRMTVDALDAHERLDKDNQDELLMLGYFMHNSRDNVKYDGVVLASLINTLIERIAFRYPEIRRLSECISSTDHWMTLGQTVIADYSHLPEHIRTKIDGVDITDKPKWSEWDYIFG